MAKKDQDMASTAKKIEGPLVKLNNLVNNLLDRSSSSNTNKRDRELAQLSKDVDDIVFQEIEGLTNFTGDDISTFLVKLFNDQESAAQTKGPIKSIEDIFENESSNIFSFFQDRYKNQNILYEDLSVISSQLFEISEALMATRDAIISADDISNSVSRTLRFKNTTEDDINKQSYIGIIESAEKNFKLLQKLKSHIIPKTLEYGKYYVYTVPYSKLFQRQYEKKVKASAKFGTTLEAVDENFVKEFKSELKIDATVMNKKITEEFNGVFENIEIFNGDDGIPIVEGTELSDLFDTPKFQKQVDRAKKEKKKNPAITADGIVDLNSKEADFSAVKDCYVKLIDPRKIIPIKILEETIGYYYIHETELKTKKSPFSMNIKLAPGSNADAREVENAFLSKITDKIVKSFDKKYLENNVKFKELILNSLIYNDVYNKQLKFQFIPVDYITEFNVNTDENGNGTSIILPSLFYAKLYLALLIFKMITIITKSNDQKIYYIRNSGLDNNVANKIQDVARSIKDKNISFMDLMNYNSMVSKVGAAKDVFMPVGRSGERGIEFDILQGQDVQLNTELMELLRSSFINATGVPSVIMNYVNEADYAKTLVMANAKFLSRVVNYQMDFNPAITEMYKKIILFSTDITPEIVDEFEFALSTPKTLDTTNMADLISNADQVISFMIKTLTGENASPTDDDNMFKDIMYKKFSKELLPMLPWLQADKLMEDGKIELQNLKAKKKAMSGDDSNESY